MAKHPSSPKLYEHHHPLGFPGSSRIHRPQLVPTASLQENHPWDPTSLFPVQSPPFPKPAPFSPDRPSTFIVYFSPFWDHHIWGISHATCHLPKLQDTSDLALDLQVSPAAPSTPFLLHIHPPLRLHTNYSLIRILVH